MEFHSDRMQSILYDMVTYFSCAFSIIYLDEADADRFLSPAVRLFASGENNQECYTGIYIHIKLLTKIMYGILLSVTCRIVSNGIQHLHNSSIIQFIKRHFSSKLVLLRSVA